MRYFILILMTCFLTLSVSGQSVNSLKKKQRQAKRQIALTNKLLKETKENKNTTVSTLKLIRKQISEREILITAINSEISVLDRRRNKIAEQRKVLQTRLTSLKKEYGDLLYHSYFHKNNQKKNQYLFILSSNSFSQGYRRLRYVEEYSEYRKKQSIQIQEITYELEKKAHELTYIIKNKALLAQGKIIEAENLQGDKKKKEEILSTLSKKEKDLYIDLRKQQKQVNSLNEEIDRLIAIEIEKARKKAEEKARKAAEERRRKAEEKERARQAANASKNKNASASSSKAAAAPAKEFTTADLMTKEEELIAGGFAKNRGRLPWPVTGIITGHFGIHNHPVLKSVQVNNKGIYIQTEKNTDACSIYDGEVTQVFSIPGNNNAIIIKHGIYRTVYANLTSTYVKIGDKVKTKQRLGKVYIDEENNNKTEIYFMLYKDSDLQNPESWLVR